MIDRERVLAVLRKRFPGATPDQVAGAANAIVGLSDEWVDVTACQSDVDYCASVHGAQTCFIADQRQQGSEFRILMKTPTE